MIKLLLLLATAMIFVFLTVFVLIRYKVSILDITDNNEREIHVVFKRRNKVKRSINLILFLLLVA